MSEQPHRPGPLAWLVIAGGWIVIGVVVAGVLREADATHPRSWATWVIGAALVHDLVVLPLVLLVGLGLGQLLRPAWRGPARAALVIGAVLALATWPTIRRFGARADNPTVLPLPAGRNLVAIVVVLALVAIVAGIVRTRRLGNPSVEDGGTT
jgi:hypothetical protein